MSTERQAFGCFFGLYAVGGLIGLVIAGAPGGLAIAYFASLFVLIIANKLWSMRSGSHLMLVRGDADATTFVDGKYCLYLRPFDWETDLVVPIGSTNDGWLREGHVLSLGECLTRTMNLQGLDLKTIGGSGKGTNTAYTEHDRWQDLALLAMRRAVAIVIVPSNNVGTYWELEQILSSELCDKTILLIPATDFSGGSASGADGYAIWTTICNTMSRAGFAAEDVASIPRTGGLYGIDQTRSMWRLSDLNIDPQGIVHGLRPPAR